MPAELTSNLERTDLKKIARTHVPVMSTSHQLLKSPFGIATPLLPGLRTIKHPFYNHSTRANLLFKGEKLSPLAEMYFEEKARADIAQAQADLYTHRSGQAEIRAEIAEAKVSLQEAQNGKLTTRIEQLQRRLDSAFENEDRLLNIIGELRRVTQQKGSVSTEASWSVLGLDPSTAFVGLTPQQQQAVLDGAYRTRSKIFHPDSGGSKEAMQRVNEAYEALKTSIK